MTRSANFCRSLYQLQDRRATGILLMLLFSVVSVDAVYRGVGTRDNGRGVIFYCEVSTVGTSPRVKIWVGTYRTEALAALACDVAFFYTKRPSKEFNLEHSEDAILRECKPRSAYDSLNDWKERKKFIRAEADALINLVSSEDLSVFHWEDVAVPPLVPIRQRSSEVARTIVKQFRNQAEQLREFMAWLMRLSNAATQSTHETFSQQQSEKTISQSHIEEALPVGGEQFLDASRVALLLDSVEARSGGDLWLTLIASSLPLLFQMFTKNNARDIKDASINANEASFTEQEGCQSTAERATKRQKVNQSSSSIELDPDQEDLFTATPLDVKYVEWQRTGYDMRSKKWRTLPPFSFLPDTDPDIRKNYSICGHDSLMCVNISAVGAELVVFNPLTGKKRPLPPLLFPRHPVLLHMLVDSATKSYRVIVAGSSSSDEGHLSKKMEVFDSKTSKWEEMCDLPGPAFGLKEYQAGVSAKGILYFISFLEGDGGKAVVAFDVENRKWLPNMTCPIPHSCIHLVENNGELYLFKEQVGYKYCIDVLEISNSASGEVSCHWRNVVTVYCGRRFGINPTYMCLGFGEGKLCVFDTIKRGAVVYDVRSWMVSEVLESLRDQRSVFHSLNPLHPFLQ